MYWNGLAIAICLVALRGEAFTEVPPPLKAADVAVSCQAAGDSTYGKTSAATSKRMSGSIEADTKAALAAEWKSPNGVTHALTALQYLTVPSKLAKGDFVGLHPDKALDELVLGDPNSKDLLKAASESSGLLDPLTRAQTLFKEESVPPGCERAVFTYTGQFIDEIYKSEPTTDNSAGKTEKHAGKGRKRAGTGDDNIGGKQKIIEINQAFGGSDNHAALYLLLKDYPNPEANFADLEILRAAFVLDAKRLAKLVSDKVVPAAMQSADSN